MTITSVPLARLTDSAALRLVCLPCAGGGTAAFHRWRPALPKQIDLVPISLPGHDGRLAEPLRTDLRLLVQDLANDLSPAMDRPYVLLGHSLGAWVAFELACELRRRGARPPELLIVVAVRPPVTKMGGSLLHTLPNDQFLTAVQARYDGIPQAILANAELLQLLLPVLRADVEMGETYRYTPEPPLDVELLALGGSEDPAVSADQLAEWSRHTARNCTVQLFPGGHFFLFRGDGQQPQSATRESPSPALRTIVASLERYLRDYHFNKSTKNAKP